MDADAVLHAAQGIGRHALPLFLLLLGLLVLAVGGIGRAWQAHLWPHARDRLPPPALLLLGIGAGLALLAGAVNAFAAMAQGQAAAGRIALFDEALSQAIGLHVGLDTLQAFRLLTRLGDSWFLTLLALAVALPLWRRGRRALALAWLLALGGNALAVPLLKRLFERVRPVHDHGLVSELGFSFPSGHTAGATVAYGMLAYLAVRLLAPRWHVPAAMLAAALAFTIGSSRVFLQVHFASDVLAGFAWGAAWLSCCVLVVELGRRWRRRTGLGALQRSR